MARLEAVADGLYYPTPEPVIGSLARLLRLEPVTPRLGGTVRVLDPCIGKGRAVALLAEQVCALASFPAVLLRPGDPESEALPVVTAGGGPAVARDPLRIELYGVELNRVRAQEAAAACHGGLLVTSFFNTTIADASFQIAFVNPPYDTDFSQGTGRHVRLELQFLKRATHKLASEGILVWIVPQARVGEAATYLASYYDQLACWRFPDEPWKAPDAAPSTEPQPMYGAYQQVVLVGRRRLGMVPPNPEQVAEIAEWAALGPDLPVLPPARAASIPEVEQTHPIYRVPLARGPAPIFEAWAYDCDATARLVSLPGTGVWHQPAYVEQHWPSLETTDLGIGRPPMPLREGHLSLLVASGAANGLEVEGKSGRRAIVKGGSVKERVRTVEVDEEGTRRDIETERFVNEVYLLDLRAGELFHVVNGTPEATGVLESADTPAAQDASIDAGERAYPGPSVRPVSTTTGAGTAPSTAAVAAAQQQPPLIFTPRTLTMAAFLAEFGPSLMARVAEAAPPLYLGPEDASFAPLSLLKRRPLGAQGLIAQAKACAIRGQRPSGDDPGWPRVRRLGNVGEMGTGKTFLALATLALADEEVSGAPATATKRPYKRSFFPALVICPPIMVEKWVREARLTLGNTVKATIIRPLETREDVAAFRSFDPTFSGKQLSALGVARRVVRRIQLDLAAWRQACVHARAAGGPLPRKPCHLVVLSHSTAKLGSAWSPRYVLRALRTPDADGHLRLLRQVDGMPSVVPCCPRCFAPLLTEEGEANVQQRSGSRRRARGRNNEATDSTDATDPIDALYLTEEQLLGASGKRVKRVCQACGERLWQVVPEVTTTQATWQATPPPIAGVYGTGHLVSARRQIAGLPLPDRQRRRAGLSGPLLRRYPIADYLRRHHRGLFRSLIADEAHEFSGGETAQALALASLQEVCRPRGTTLWLTGTLFSGYASELFQMQRIVNDAILRQFGWHGHRRWMELYGVERHIVVTPPPDREVGAVSKRKEGREVTQELPGISPLMLRHILPCCVFVELADVARDLPPLMEEVRAVPLGPVLEPIYRRFEQEATVALHAQLATGDRGALSSWYHGLLIQPNLPSRAIEVRHAGTGEVLACTEPFPEATIWPKEAELLCLIREERTRDRRVLVFVEHTGAYDLLARLAGLIEADDVRWRQGLPPDAPDATEVSDDEIGPGAADLNATVAEQLVQGSNPGPMRPPLGSVRVAILRSNTCPTARREAWLTRTVQRGCDVLLVHSACVQVGLDLLDFPTIVCFETIPSTNRARQATRRSYRPGQKLPVRVIQLTYDGTAEARLLLLVARKMRNSLMAEGKLPGEGLATYGEDEGDLMLQLARAVLEDARHNATGRGMAGSLEAIFQEVQRLDQQANQFIGGERLEAALAGAAATGDGSREGLCPHETVVEAMPVPHTAMQAAPPIATPATNHHEDTAPMTVTLVGALHEGESGSQSGEANGNGIARVTRVTTPSTSSGGRSWAELASELQQLKDLRRRGQHGRGVVDGKANGRALGSGGDATPSLWSEHAGITAASLWEPSTPTAPTSPPGDGQPTTLSEPGSFNEDSAAGIPSSTSLWKSVVSQPPAGHD